MKPSSKCFSFLLALVLLFLPLQVSGANPSLIPLTQNRTSGGVLAVDSYQYLWFSAKKNNPVLFTLGKSGDLWYRFKILDAGGSNVLLSTDVEQREREVTFAPPYDGNYYVLLLGYYSYGKYSLRFQNVLSSPVAADSLFPLRTGIRRTDTIANGVIRHYGFYGRHNEPLRLTITPERDVWVRVRIFAPDGRVLRTEDIESGKREIIFTPHQDGDYRLSIAGFYGSGRVSLALDMIKHLL